MLIEGLQRGLREMQQRSVVVGRPRKNGGDAKWNENPFIGKVSPPFGPWKDKITIAEMGPYKKSTNKEGEYAYYEPYS